MQAKLSCILLLFTVISFGQNKPKDHSTVTQSEPGLRFVEQMPEFPGELPALVPVAMGEAVYVVFQMPKWKAGKQNGAAVDIYYTLPITFKLG